MEGALVFGLLGIVRLSGFGKFWKKFEFSTFEIQIWIRIVYFGGLYTIDEASKMSSFRAFFMYMLEDV